MFQIPKYFGSIEDLIKREGEAAKIWELCRSQHQEAYDFALPDRETFRWRTQGQRKNRHIFDSTAIQGLETYVNKIQAGYFPDWQEWAEFIPGEQIPEEEKDAITAKLEKVTKAFFGLFHQSNFSTEITPSLKDWGIGTGCIEVMEGRINRPSEPLFNFVNVPLAELYLEKPAYGAVKSSWRSFEIEAINIKTTWPDADIPNSLEQIIKNSPFTKIKLSNGHVYNPQNDKYYQFIIWKKDKVLLYSQEFNTCRRIVFRDSITPGEVYGRGVIIRTLANIRTCNIIKEFSLNAAALNTAGIYTARADNVFNPYNTVIKPGGVIAVSSNDSRNPTLQKLPPAGDPTFGQIELMDERETINNAMFAKPIGDISDPVRSATEMSIRLQDELKRSSASFGRLYSELVVPVVKACFDIGKQRGELPEIAIDGKEIRVNMVSPLAKQKEMDDFQNMQAWWAFLQTLNPEVRLASVREEDIPHKSAEMLSIPLDLMREKKERDAIVNAVMQASQGGAPVE